jgi:hypothetical protein
MEKERRKKKKINVVGTALLKHQQWRTKQRIVGADACNGETSAVLLQLIENRKPTYRIQIKFQ